MSDSSETMYKKEQEARYEKDSEAMYQEELEAWYLLLVKKSIHEQLTKEETEEMQIIQNGLKHETCDACSGLTGFYIPLTKGDRNKFRECTKCNGTGELNISPALQEVLEALYKGGRRI